MSSQWLLYFSIFSTLLVPDILINVWEWCQDCYDPDYYSVSPTDDPTGPTTGAARAVRGGSWDDDARDVRSAARYAGVPGVRSDSLGFRCALDQP